MPRNSYNLCWESKAVLLLPLVDVTLKIKKIAKCRLAAVDYLDRKRRSRNFFTLQNGKFYFTDKSQLSHLFRLATPSLPGSASLVCDNQNQNQQTIMLKKGVNSTTETRKWASANLPYILVYKSNACISRTLFLKPKIQLF